MRSNVSGVRSGCQCYRVDGCLDANPTSAVVGCKCWPTHGARRLCQTSFDCVFRGIVGQIGRHQLLRCLILQSLHPVSRPQWNDVVFCLRSHSVPMSDSYEAGTSYRPAWLDGQVASTVGDASRLLLKAFVWNDSGEVTWSLVPVLEYLLGDTAQKNHVRWNRLIKDLSVNWSVLCVAASVPDVGIWYQSQRQWMENYGPDVPMPRFVVEQQSASSMGLLIVVLSWARQRRRDTDRRRGWDLLAYLLRTLLLPSDGAMPGLRDQILRWSAAGTCEIRRARSCGHILRVLALDFEDAHDLLFQTMRTLALHIFSCDRCARVLGLWLHVLVRRIKTRSHLIAFDAEASHHPFTAGQHKRRRLDLDFHRQIKQTILKQRVSGGRGSVAKVNTVGRWSLSRRDRREMLIHMAACWRRWSEVPSGLFHIKEDAARLGQPAREYNHSALAWPLTREAAYLPPQDRHSTVHVVLCNS